MASASSRMGAGLNLTPKATSHLRSPSKNAQNEQNLILRKVIGTTSTSNSAFDYLESGRCFAFTAGAAVVVATFDENFQISQRFFRARSVPAVLLPTTPLYDSPTPYGTSQGPRNRATPRHRELSNQNSYFGSPGSDAVDSPSKRKAAVRDRTKTATCLSFSPDGKFLAVGETGHKPRVLVYSTSPDASADIPLITLSEHTFGVRCVAFSPDSQYLATLGDVNDGFLHIWRINQRNIGAVLHASNKCTSSVRQVAWLGNSLITVGTRHVKIWRVEVAIPDTSQSRFMDPSSGTPPEALRTLSGRNCLLGPLLDQTFTAVEPISSDKAVVCSEQGDICLLNDTDASPLFIKVAEAGFKANALAVQLGKSLLVGGHCGGGRLFPLDAFLNHSHKLDTSLPTIGTQIQFYRGSESVKALAFLQRRVITLNASRSFQIFELDSNNVPSVSESSTQLLPAHASAVLGIQGVSAPNALGAAFLTWSAEGLVMFWDYGGSYKGALSIRLEHLHDNSEFSNELKVVRLWHNNQYVASGDRYGVLRVTELADGEYIHDVKAHIGEITDIASWHKGNKVLLASSGRDRVVQVYSWEREQLKLLQTLDEHVGSVAGIFVTVGGERMLSYSSDRTVIVRESVLQDHPDHAFSAFLKTRTIVLKTTPTALVVSTDDPEIILVSTHDRQVLRYDLQSGDMVSGFKVCNSEGGDTVVLNSVIRMPMNRSHCIIVGTSNTDKSIRMYDESGRLLAREYGHTEGITGIATIENASTNGDRSVVSVAADGTIFIWGTAVETRRISGTAETLDTGTDTSRAKVLLAPKAPLRRVLSSSELARLQELRVAQERGESVTGGAAERPTHKRRPSKLSSSQTLSGRCPTNPSDRRTIQSSASPTPEVYHRKEPVFQPTSTRTPGEQSPASRRKLQLPSAATPSRPRGKSLGSVVTTSELSALIIAADQVCRSLDHFRKKLAASSEVLLPVEHARELERELSTTAKAVAEKAARSEPAMVKLLDEYSERLVGLLDEKIEASVARQVERRLENSVAKEGAE